MNVHIKHAIAALERQRTADANCARRVFRSSSSSLNGPLRADQLEHYEKYVAEIDASITWLRALANEVERLQGATP
jgi:hypothetical protein